MTSNCSFFEWPWEKALRSFLNLLSRPHPCQRHKTVWSRWLILRILPLFPLSAYTATYRAHIKCNGKRPILLNDRQANTIRCLCESCTNLTQQICVCKDERDGLGTHLCRFVYPFICCMNVCGCMYKEKSFWQVGSGSDLQSLVTKVGQCIFNIG